MYSLVALSHILFNLLSMFQCKVQHLRDGCDGNWRPGGDKGTRSVGVVRSLMGPPCMELPLESYNERRDARTHSSAHW